jgi:radical SAM superfamily enzyme YgiQ (UPF0313 family)
MPTLTLPTLAAVIPEEDWDIEMQDALVGPLAFDRDYELVLITVTTAVAARAYEAARRFRRRGATVVLGGMHPAVLPDEAAQHADAVVIGEGERTLPRLLEDFRRGKLDPLYRMPPMVDRWDRRPPRWDLLPKGDALRESLTAPRGWHDRCTVCSMPLALGGGQYGYRKPPPAAVAEIVVPCSSPWVMFWDEDLLSAPPYTTARCAAVQPLQKHWMRQMSATDVAQHPERLQGLAESGCAAMFLGLESLSQASLKSVQKPNTAQLYEALIRRVHAQGIESHAGFGCGLDHDAVSSFARTAAWVNRMGRGGAICRILPPDPGTRLFEQRRAAGRLLTTNWTSYSGEHVVYRPAKMTVEELSWGQQWVKRQCYAYRAIGERALRRVGLARLGAVVTTVVAGLGYRSMFHLPAEAVSVDVYRDHEEQCTNVSSPRFARAPGPRTDVRHARAHAFTLPLCPSAPLSPYRSSHSAAARPPKSKVGLGA